MEDFSAAIKCIAKKNLIINRDYESFLRDIHMDSFESIWQYQNGETIKSIRPRSVIRFQTAHHNKKKTIYLKRHNLEFVGFWRLFPHFFHRRGLSQGRLEFENICDFRNSNLQTVIPIAAGENFFRFFWAESFLITEDFYPYISLEALLKDRPDFFTGQEGEHRKRVLINEISVLARKMHENGFNHQDFNATHILLNYDNESDVPKLALFDLQRVETNKLFRFRWKIKSLARLNYTLPDKIFNKKDRINILLFYKGKTRLNFLDQLQWIWIKKKTARIKRHTGKKLALKYKKIR